MATNSDNSSGARNGEAPGSTAVAQLVEQRIPNPQVAGSSPSRRDSEGGASPFYKSGQGFWVRWMTAALAGLLVLAAAGWVWNQLSLISLPTPTWRMTIKDGVFNAAPGPQVELLVRGAREGQYDVIGQGTVALWEQASKGVHTLQIRDLQMNEGQTASSTAAVRTLGASVIAPIEGRAGGIPIVQLEYVKATGAGLVLIAGALTILWFVGLRARSVDFLIATDAEMKKVNWSTRKEVVGTTQVVIVAFFLIAAVIFGIDTIFKTVFELLRVIRTA